MNKEDYEIERISKAGAATLLLRYHYLKDISKGFKSGINYGLFRNQTLVGVIIFTGFPTPELAVGLFGLNRSDQGGLLELSRLVLLPSEQEVSHNLASWFVSRAIKLLRKETQVRCILSYADCDYHKGTVYRASNFKYYGKSDPKKDFWIKQADGSFIKHSRGKIKGLDGEWRPRSQKHRFLLVYDKHLMVRWAEMESLLC